MDPPNSFHISAYPTQTRTVTFHSGTQPTANQVVSGWTNYCSTNSTFLAIKDIVIKEVSTASFTLNVITTGTTIRSGTATWAIIYNTSTSVTSATTTASMLLSGTAGTPIVVVPVSDINTTTGVIKLNSANLIANSIFTITDFTMILTSP